MREPFDQNNKSIEIAQRLPLCTGQILSKYVSIQDASDPAQFERARSWDKDQGEPTGTSILSQPWAWCSSQSGKMRQNTPQEMDQEKFYATEERAEFFTRNRFI